MQIELVTSPTLYDTRMLLSNHITIAIDILRATSAICAAFSAGASEIVPLNSTEMLDDFARRGYIIAAERNGSKLKGAACGNSPTEYMSLDLTAQRLAYSTTNGTVSILRAKDSDLLLVGAFANITSLSEAIVNKGCESLVLLCSGWKGDPSIEDTLFGGALIQHLKDLGSKVKLINDSALIALDLWNLASSDLYGYCSKATHVHRLLSLGCDDDIRWSLQQDTCQVVPVYDPNTQSLKLL